MFRFMYLYDTLFVCTLFSERRCTQLLLLYCIQCTSDRMGILFSLPLAGPLGTIATSCIGGLAFCFTSTAGQSVVMRRMAALTL